MTRDQLRAIKPGDLVMMTEAARRQRLFGPRNIASGTVTDVRINAGLVKVRRDGIKAAEWYSKNFWVMQASRVSETDDG